MSSGLAFVPLVITPTYNAAKAAIHSYTIALRRQLQGTSMEVLEFIAPSMQTDLMPAHAENSHALPLANLIAETMVEFRKAPIPQEIKLRRLLLRDAEAEGRSEQTLEILNGTHSC